MKFTDSLRYDECGHRQNKNKKTVFCNTLLIGISEICTASNTLHGNNCNESDDSQFKIDWIANYHIKKQHRFAWYKYKIIKAQFVHQSIKTPEIKQHFIAGKLARIQGSKSFMFFSNFKTFGRSVSCFKCFEQKKHIVSNAKEIKVILCLKIMLKFIWQNGVLATILCCLLQMFWALHTPNIRAKNDLFGAFPTILQIQISRFVSFALLSHGCARFFYLLHGPNHMTGIFSPSTFFN